ncbi:hypothetical protein EON81_10005 [bacterium]|nr:MAG: hypothetical protein EON81_10005 [bacterium]
MIATIDIKPSKIGLIVIHKGGDSLRSFRERLDGIRREAAQIEQNPSRTTAKALKGRLERLCETARAEWLKGWRKANPQQDYRPYDADDADSYDKYDGDEEIAQFCKEAQSALSDFERRFAKVLGGGR